MKKKEKSDFDLSRVIGGNLNIFGLKLDLAQLLSSPEDVKGQLEGLRERLKVLGGKEALSDEEWKQGGATVSGYVRTRGILGDEEYHIGTSGGRAPRAKGGKPAAPPEVVEPSLDLFDEPQGVTIVADVPGIDLEDLEVKVNGRVLSIASKASARRAYRKTVRLAPEVEPESLEASCRNGVLEIRLRKKPGEGPE